ncbi:hypothetical protein IQ26_04190, partial [Mesorhizobium tianshanense]
RCCAASTSGSGEGFDPLHGSNGSAGAPALRSCVAGASGTSWRHKPPAARMVPGASATAQRSPLPCRTLSSQASASLSSPLPMPHNQPNRLVRARTQGGVGGEEPQGSPLSRFQASVPSLKPAKWMPATLLLGRNEILDLPRNQPGLERDTPGKLGCGGARSAHRPVEPVGYRAEDSAVVDSDDAA